MSTGSIFTKIIERQIPADILFEDEQAIAFRDIHPAAPFHALVVPKREIANIEAMEAQDASLFGHLLWVCKKVANDAGHTSYRVVANSGSDVGQTVFHQHFHVLAGRIFRWPPG
jgi:histidine triad (HIT) family protein